MACDITVSKRVKLGLFPTGSIPLKLDPTHHYNFAFVTFGGELTPFYCKEIEELCELPLISAAINCLLPFFPLPFISCH